MSTVLIWMEWGNKQAFQASTCDWISGVVSCFKPLTPYVDIARYSFLSIFSMSSASVYHLGNMCNGFYSFLYLFHC